MWNWNNAFIVVFLYSNWIEPCISGGSVSVHLLEYHKSSDTGCKGGLYSSSHPCDPLFTFCLKGLSNKVYCTKMSDQYKGTRDVKFGTSINGGIANPIVKPFTSLQAGAVFEAKVGDDYWLSNTPLPLDDMTTPLPPSHNGTTITLTDKDARLTLTITVTCDPHYYGPRCSVLCDPGPADHYTCAPDGTKRCIKGYSGSSCQQTPCHNVACHNGGKCRVVGSTFNCSCPPGFNGTHCETSSCTKNPCLNQGTCHYSGSKITCSCKPGFNGTTCQSTPCTKNPCQNQGTCHFRGSKFICSCKPGFNGTHCETTPCTKNPCQNQGMCHFTGSKATCSCKSGFNGTHCETTSCTKNPCQNQGTCHIVGSKVTCSCKPGFNGTHCETTPCTKNPCQNQGTCHIVGSKATCSCKSGFNGILCETTPCTRSPCQNQGTCHYSGSKVTCSCKSGFNGLHCDTPSNTKKVTASSTLETAGTPSNSPPTGCLHNISNCVFAECPYPNPARCVRCQAGYTQVEGRCMACPSRTPILHCEEEASSGCLFRWCRRCEQGFYREASACEVCPRLHAGCRDHVCSSTDDVRCVSCHPGFFLAGGYCKECPSPNPTCDEVICSDANDVTCTKCKDGYLEVDGQCILCPSTSLIPDCVDVVRDGCFKHWCRKCAPGFFISGTACDVCLLPDVGCELAECNSTKDSQCAKCFHGYDLQGGTCTHSHGNESTTTSTQCVDSPHVNCASLQSSLKVCSEPSTACRYCPRYCNMCHTCTQGVPIIG